MAKKFERPFKGSTGWEVTLFGFQFFRANDKIMEDRKFHNINIKRWQVSKVA